MTRKIILEENELIKMYIIKKLY